VEPEHAPKGAKERVNNESEKMVLRLILHWEKGASRACGLWLCVSQRRRRRSAASRSRCLVAVEGGGEVAVRRWREERRWRAMRRVLWGRERELRWWRVREKSVGEERREARRRWWWRVAERMEWVRSENWEGVRVESAAMMIDVDVSSIGIPAFGLLLFRL